MKELDIPDASVWYTSNAYPNHFDVLKSKLNWNQDYINIYGKSIAIPRLTAWYGKTYTYSGIKNPQNFDYPEIITDIMGSLNEYLPLAKFNSVLANYYEDGSHSIGYHSDNERELGKTPIIASLSFGGSRIFSFKHKAGKHPDYSITLNDGDLLIMFGFTQQNWNHGIEKVKKAEPRINLTFRRVI